MAVKTVDAALWLRLTKEPRDHRNREDLLKGDRVFQPIYRAYMSLKNGSLMSRYLSDEAHRPIRDFSDVCTEEEAWNEYVALRLASVLNEAKKITNNPDIRTLDCPKRQHQESKR